MDLENAEQLPPSSYSPIEVVVEDWDVLNSELIAVEFKLAMIKRDFAALDSV